MRRGLCLALSIALGFMLTPMLMPPVAADPTATSPPGGLFGRVTNADNGSPLKFAFVTVTGTNLPKEIVGTTNADGTYRIQIPPGIYAVRISFMLYPQKVFSDVEIKPGEGTRLDAALNRKEQVTFNGIVVNAQNGTPIAGANVAIKGQEPAGQMFGAISGSDGRFTVQLPAGRYEITALYFLFDKAVLPNVLVGKVNATTFQIRMTPQNVQTKEILVQGNRIGNTKVAELQTRRKASAITDGISHDQIARSSDSDAGQVLKRVTGLSIKDSKYVIVRGLSERYASTSLNGVRVATPDPTRKIVPLDIFPSGLLDNITVQKAYTPDQPGEFGGGSVQITTREIPDGPIWKQTFSTGLTSGQRGSGLGYHGGGLDFLGIDDGTRGLPDIVRRNALDKLIKLKDPFFPNGPGFTKDEYIAIARSFKDQWSPTPSDYHPNAGLSQTAGTRTSFLGHPLGLVGSMSYSGGMNTIRRDQNFYESVELVPKSLLKEVRTTRSVLWGGTGTSTLRFSGNSALKAGLFYSRSTDDEARSYQGQYFDRGKYARAQRLLYAQRQLLMATLGGEHALPLLKSRLEWKLNRSRAERDEPDRRENQYEGPDLSNPVDLDTLDVTDWSWVSATRLYSEVHDREKGGEASLTIPFHSWTAGDVRLKFGFQHQSKNRDSWTRRFEYRTRGVDPYAPVDTVLQDSNMQTTVSFIDATNGTDIYFATQSLTAGYFMVETPLLSRLRMTTGARVEHSVQSISTYSDAAFNSPLKRFGQNITDVMPTLNLTCALNGRTNLRFAASQTVSRPDLRELTDFSLFNYLGGFRETGNPDLKRARLQSYDLRCETFPGLSELFAASLFYKKMLHPIENAIQGGSAPNTFPINAIRGENYGAEFEIQSGLGRLLHPFKSWSVIANLTLVHTEAEIPRTGVSTSVKHPLDGQSKYVANVGLFYTSPGKYTEVSAFYNTYGRRLAGVGIYGQPDVYERSLTSLDVSWSQMIWSRTRLKLAGKNLLNPARVLEQGDRIRESYKPGSSFSLAIGLGS